MSTPHSARPARRRIGGLSREERQALWESYVVPRDMTAFQIGLREGTIRLTPNGARRVARAGRKG